MNRSELSDFLHQLLTGSVPVEGGDQDEPPFLAARRVYSTLSALERQPFTEAILHSLSQIESTLETPWRDDVADQLLLLASEVFCSAPDQLRQQAIDQLRHIGGGPYSPTLQDRALALLPSLGHRGTPEFWTQIARDGSEQRARVAIRGLAQLGDLALAFQWAAPPDASVAKLKALATLLPWFVERFGTVSIRDLLKSVWGDIPPEHRAEFRSWSKVLGIDLPDRNERLLSALDSWSPDVPIEVTASLLSRAIVACEVDDSHLLKFAQRLGAVILDHRRNGSLFASAPLCRAYLQASKWTSNDDTLFVAALAIEEKDAGIDAYDSAIERLLTNRRASGGKDKDDYS